MDPIDLSGLSVAETHPSQSHQSNLSDASPFNPRLRDKLNKLAKWRIDPSLIEFPEDTSVFEGGHATVSRALLTPASAAGMNEPKSVEGGQSPRDGSVKKKVVAVKRLRSKNENSSGKLLELGLREAGFLVELSHPHIIKLEGFVEESSRDEIRLVFLWEEHGNLKHFAASQDWEIPERISLIGDVARGVEYLHSLSPPIYHGDLKSINVLVTSECRAVITDFGSARRLTKKAVDPQLVQTENKAKSAPEFEATFSAESNTMTFTGNEYTLRWAAPELLMDDEAGLSSDIWALGWIFYEVMTNSIPFENVKKDAVVVMHVVDGKLPSVTDHIRMSLILRLCSLMVKCWNVDPTNRPTAEDCSKSLRWMPRIIPLSGRPSDTTVGSKARSAQLLMELGYMHKSQSDYLEASNLFTEALAIYTELSDNAGRASALYALGLANVMQGKHSKAATFYNEALQIRTDLGDAQGRAETLRTLAKVHKDQKEYGKAIELYSEVVQISLATENAHQRADALRGLAGVHRAQGNYDQALISYSEAIEIYTDGGGLIGRAETLWGLAEMHRLQGHYTQAVALFSESAQLSTDIGYRFGTANALLCLGFVHTKQGQYNDAIDLYKQASVIFEQIGHTGKVAEASRWTVHARTQLEAMRVE